jgi:hypothetical protein
VSGAATTTTPPNASILEAAVTPPAAFESPHQGENMETRTSDFLAHSETHQSVVHSEESRAAIPDIYAFPAMVFIESNPTTTSDPHRYSIIISATSWVETLASNCPVLRSPGRLNSSNAFFCQ